MTLDFGTLHVIYKAYIKKRLKGAQKVRQTDDVNYVAIETEGPFAGYAVHLHDVALGMRLLQLSQILASKQAT